MSVLFVKVHDSFALLHLGWTDQGLDVSHFPTFLYRLYI